MAEGELKEKLNKLEATLKGYGHVIVALSGGVDSTFLVAFAHRTFMKEAGAGGEPAEECVAAITAAGPQFIKGEENYARRFCEERGIAHKTIDAAHVLDVVKENTPQRCYYCKRELFGMMKDRADMVGSVLCDGTNADDEKDYRPGNRAAAELGIVSPLKEAGLTKAEIRMAMKELSLAEDRAEYPAFACLASRVPYGEEITEEKLEAIAEAEEFLKDRGFTQARVRCHEVAGKSDERHYGLMARIELLKEEQCRMFEMLVEADMAMRRIGFEYSAMDLGGYEMGRMNKKI